MIDSQYALLDGCAVFGGISGVSSYCSYLWMAPSSHHCSKLMDRDFFAPTPSKSPAASRTCLMLFFVFTDRNPNYPPTPTRQTKNQTVHESKGGNLWGPKVEKAFSTTKRSLALLVPMADPYDHLFKLLLVNEITSLSIIGSNPLICCADLAGKIWIVLFHGTLTAFSLIQS